MRVRTWDGRCEEEVGIREVRIQGRGGRIEAGHMREDSTPACDLLPTPLLPTLLLSTSPLPTSSRPNSPLRQRAGRTYLAVTIYLVMFGLLVAVLSHFYLLPAIRASH